VKQKRGTRGKETLLKLDQKPEEKGRMQVGRQREGWAQNQMFAVE
jgi:hypothetical protein